MVKQFILPLVILLFVGSTLAQDATPVLTAEDLANTDLMKVVNNYFGCKTWKDGVCV